MFYNIYFPGSQKIAVSYGYDWRPAAKYTDSFNKDMVHYFVSIRIKNLNLYDRIQIL